MTHNGCKDTGDDGDEDASLVSAGQAELVWSLVLSLKRKLFILCRQLKNVTIPQKHLGRKKWNVS